MGAGQSTTESPSTSASPSSPPSSSSPSSSSSTSPFSLSPLTPSKLCEFSKQKTDEFKKEIEILKDSEFKMLKETKVPEIPANVAAKMFQLPSFSFETKQSHLDDPDINRYPLLIKRILCLMVIDILKKYKEILEKTNALCIKCQSEEALEDVDGKIDKIITEFEEGFKFFNLFIENFQKGNFGDEEYGTMLKNKLVQVTSETNKRFENIERIKTAMKAICMDRQKSQEARSAIYSGKFGGTRSKSKSRSKSRSKSIKRKQKKMKSSSKHLSKTRNHKKIQQ